MGLTFLLGLCQFVTEGCIFVRHIKFQHIISSPRRGHCWFRNKQRLWDLLKSMDSQYASLAEVFYGAIYWSPIITSKNWSEFLSNQNKHLCFFCFQDKLWINMPKWTIFLISSEEFVLITENFWLVFWRDKWRSIISVVENFRFWWIFPKFPSFSSRPEKTNRNISHSCNVMEQESADLKVGGLQNRSHECETECEMIKTFIGL